MVRNNENLRRRVEKLAQGVAALHIDTRCRACHYPERRGPRSLCRLSEETEAPTPTCPQCGREVDDKGETLTLLDVDGALVQAHVVQIVLVRSRPDGSTPSPLFGGRGYPPRTG
jgi:hypothetical protein